MNAAFERDKEITGKLDSQLEAVRNYRRSQHAENLFLFAQQLLKADHIVVTLLKGILLNHDQNNNSDEASDGDSSLTDAEKLGPEAGEVQDSVEAAVKLSDSELDSGPGAERIAAAAVAGVAAAAVAPSRSSMSLISASK